MAGRMRSGPAAGMENIRKPYWFSLLQHQNPKAIIPLYLSGFGSFCWETAAFWGDLDTPGSYQAWVVLVLIGLICMLLGFIGGCVYRHYKVAALAIIISILSPLLWFFVCLYLHPIIGDEKGHGFHVNLWLWFQIPLVLIALWRSRWSKSVKIAVTVSAAGGLVCLFIVHAAIASREAALAPRFTDHDLSFLYEKKDVAALQRLIHKRIIVTGVVGGQSEGLFGGGPPGMKGVDGGPDIECDDLGTLDSVADGQKVSILGTCQGKDVYGIIHLTDCRVVGQ